MSSISSQVLSNSLGVVATSPYIRPEFLRKSDLAIRWSCSPKTIANKVTLGLLPRPLQLPIGPRWPIALVEAIESGEWQPSSKTSDAPPSRGRGRPRIAAQRAGGAK